MEGTGNLMEWFPAITTTGLLAAALWLARNLISTRLTRSVEHEFNRKLESLRSEHRQREDLLRAELQARATEIEALRTGALSNMSGRQAAADKRRLEAIDQLWSGVLALGPARMLASYLSVLNIRAMGERVQRDEKARQFVEMFGAGFDPKSIDYSTGAKARPFVSPMAWAIYSALQAVTGIAIIQWHALKSGLEPTKLVDEDRAKALITAALPHYKDFLDKFGAQGFYHTIEPLESQLLVEFQRMLSGTEDDKASVERAAEILKHANALKQAAENPGAAA